MQSNKVISYNGDEIKGKKQIFFKVGKDRLNLSKEELNNRVTKLFYNMMQQLEKEGVCYKEVFFSSVLERRITSGNKIYEYYYYPNNLKEKIASSLKMLALDNGYYLKIYYNPRESDFVEINSNETFKNPQNFFVALYTEEKFLEDLQKSLKDLNDIYNAKLQHPDYYYTNMDSAVFADFIAQRLAYILKFYEDVPNLEDIASNLGISIKNIVNVKTLIKNYE